MATCAAPGPCWTNQSFNTTQSPPRHGSAMLRGLRWSLPKNKPLQPWCTKLAFPNSERLKKTFWGMVQSYTIYGQPHRAFLGSTIACASYWEEGSNFTAGTTFLDDLNSYRALQWLHMASLARSPHDWTVRGLHFGSLRSLRSKMAGE